MVTKNQYIKEKYSKRHHYLPVFYLKGFADNNKLLYIYDKEKDTILCQQRPESKFYEKNLNNYKFKGKVRFTLEEPVFTPMDTSGSKLFAKINSSESIEKDLLTAIEKFEFLNYISTLYWRSPDSNKLFVELIKKEGLSNKYFGFYNKENNELIPDEEISEVKNQFLNDEEIQKVFKHIIPLTDGTQEELFRLHEKWRLYSLNVKTPNLITGDTPFLINNDDIRLDNIFNELIFPISKYRLLILSSKSPCFLDETLLTNVNISILHQAKRFIAAESEELIRQLLVYYNRLIQKNLEKNIVKETFKHMYYQTTFKDYNDYYKAYVIGKAKYDQRT